MTDPIIVSSKPSLVGIPAEVRQYIFSLEGKVEQSWAGKHVVIVIAITAVLSAIFGHAV